MTFILTEHDSVANKFIAELRDVNVQKDRMRFRKNLERVGEVLAYEISKTLAYEKLEVETPLGIAHTKTHSENIILATVLRAGIPFHRGFLNYFDDAQNAFISSYRMHHKDGSFEIKLEYLSCPKLENSTLIICDAMLATGASMALALKAMLDQGTPKNIHVAAAIASTSGMNYIKRMFPKTNIWLGALDEELTARSFIVPGLGDAGDLAYGTKMQE